MVERTLSVARVRELNAKDYFCQMLKDNPEIDPDRCIIGSDFGQVLHMDAVDGMRVFLRALLGFGIKPEEVTLMLKDNPAKLMWLDG